MSKTWMIKSIYNLIHVLILNSSLYKWMFVRYFYAQRQKSKCLSVCETPFVKVCRFTKAHTYCYCILMAESNEYHNGIDEFTSIQRIVAGICNAPW
jgi:hypothetical protein